MSETLTQHVVLSDGEYDDLVKRLALAEAVVVVAAEYRDAQRQWDETSHAQHRANLAWADRLIAAQEAIDLALASYRSAT